MDKKRTRQAPIETIGAAGLTDKQQAFIDHYLTCWNATEAARRAGYSAKTAGAIGFENLKKPDIRSVIDQRLKDMRLSADEVLARLSDLAGADMGDFLSLSGRGVKLDLKRAQALGKLHLVRKFSRTKQGMAIELHDAKDALVQLGRYHGLFTDKIAGEVEMLTPEEMERRRQERWTKAAPALAAALKGRGAGQTSEGDDEA